MIMSSIFFAVSSALTVTKVLPRGPSAVTARDGFFSDPWKFSGNRNGKTISDKNGDTYQ